MDVSVFRDGGVVECESVLARVRRLGHDLEPRLNLRRVMPGLAGDASSSKKDNALGAIPLLEEQYEGGVEVAVLRNAGSSGKRGRAVNEKVQVRARRYGDLALLEERRLER